jgi:hypothetical protein
MTAATGMSGIMNYPWESGYSFDGTIRQMVGFVVGSPGRLTRSHAVRGFLGDIHEIVG